MEKQSLKKVVVIAICALHLTGEAQPGSLDLSFDAGLGAGNNWIQSAALQSDGKILLGGSFTSFAGNTQNRLVRLQANGNVDNTFNIGTGPSTWVTTLVVDSSDAIIVGGQFSTYNGTPRNYVVALNGSGGINPSFVPSGIPGSYVNVCKFQSDKKVVVGGIFSNGIARLNLNGSNDATFNVGTGANDWVQAMAIQNDGKILIGGSFITYNGTTRNRIARINTDGSLDSSFDPLGGANSAVRDICIQPDGKIILVGEFTTFNGNSQSRIVRLNANGSVDNTFNVGSGAIGNILTAELQLDGKLLIGGNFTSFNGISRNRLTRINNDGSLDTGFNSGNGADGTVWSIALQNDGRIIIAGGFTSYNNVTRNRVARLNGGNSTPTAADELERDSNGNCSIFPNPVINELNLSLVTNGEKFINVSIYNTLGEKKQTFSFSVEYNNSQHIQIPLDFLSKGLYQMEISTENWTCYKKFLKE